MKVILSIGFGRLHLVNTATSLGRLGVKVLLVCGWVPRNAESWLVRMCSCIVRRDISPGLKKRLVGRTDNVEVSSLAFVEFIAQFVFVFIRVVCRGLGRNYAESLMWALFGFVSRREIRRLSHEGTGIFHVRAGAGQGGAIRLARKLGYKILVDHSALHPSKTGEILVDDCQRWNVPVPIKADFGVWKNVLKDCNDGDILMVNANHIRDSFIEYGYDPAKIRVVYLGVRDDFRNLAIQRMEAGVKNEVIKVLFTGSFYILKGAEYILESLRILKGRGVKVQYDIVGTVSVPSRMLDKYKGLPIKFHGPVPQDDLRHFLSESDIYLFPSLADGCAQSGMEALTAGLAVVATYQSGLPIVDGETGYIVPIKDAGSIAAKIEFLIANPDVRERIGRTAAKMMAEKYRWSNYAENVKNVYMEMIKND